MGLLVFMDAELNAGNGVGTFEEVGAEGEPLEGEPDELLAAEVVVSITGVRGLFWVPIGVTVEFGLNTTSRAIRRTLAQVSLVRLHDTERGTL